MGIGSGGRRAAATARSRVTICSLLAVVSMAAAACSSGAGRAPVDRGIHVQAQRRGTTPTSSPEERAVVAAWTAAENTLYGYLQQPWQQVRPGLVAGESAAQLWPELTRYFSSPALRSEINFLIQVKMAQLSGPNSYDLGHPAVTALSGANAVVQGCIYDSGTTTIRGAPGPATLDGGGPGGYKGNWTLNLTNSRWRVTGFATKSVPKC